MNINKRTYPDGLVRWRARYPDPSRGGKKQIERQFVTKREAERWLTTQRSSVQRGEHVNPGDRERRFSDVAKAWRESQVDLEPKTTAGYDSILRTHLLPRWGDAKLSGVTPEAIQEFINELAERRQPATVWRVYSALRGVLKVAVERRYLTVNPCDAVRLPKQDRNGKLRIVLTAAEVQRLAEAIDPHFRVFIYTAAYMGLRAGELGALRRRDVDTLHGKLNVEEALKDVHGHLIFGATKSRSHRRLGLPRFLVDMLTDHLAALDGGPDALLFTGQEGGPLRHGNFYQRHFRPTVRYRFCEACREAVTAEAESCEACGATELVYVLPPDKHALRFHDLRHTCASLLIAAGAHPKAIQEHLGHKDIQTTFNIYGHLLPSAQDALAAALDATYQQADDPAENVIELRDAE